MADIDILKASDAAAMTNKAVCDNYDSSETLFELKKLTMERIKEAVANREYSISFAVSSIYGDLYNHGFVDWLTALGYDVKSEVKNHFIESAPDACTKITISWYNKKGENIWL